jgi:hypothetical protein
MADPVASDPNNSTSQSPPESPPVRTPEGGSAAPDATSEKPAGTTPRPDASASRS